MCKSNGSLTYHNIRISQPRKKKFLRFTWKLHSSGTGSAVAQHKKNSIIKKCNKYNFFLVSWVICEWNLQFEKCINVIECMRLLKWYFVGRRAEALYQIHGLHMLLCRFFIIIWMSLEPTIFIHIFCVTTFLLIVYANNIQLNDSYFDRQ